MHHIIGTLSPTEVVATGVRQARMTSRQIGARRLLAAVLSLAVLCCLAGSAAGAASTLPEERSSHIDGFGIGSSAHLRVGYERVSEALNAQLEMGVRWTREEIPWAEVEPTEDDFRFNYPFGNQPRDYDHLLDELDKRNIQMVALLDYGPVYISEPTPDELVTRWETYVERVVNEFGDRIDYWEIGNEMNSPLFWGKVVHPVDWQPAEPNPALYSRMLRSAHRIIKEEDPGDVVILGGLVYHLSNDCSTNPFAYLAQLYQAGAWEYFDAIAIHPYRKHSPETLLSRGHPVDTDSGACKTDSVMTYKLIEEIRAIGELAEGYGSKSIWVTEVGWDRTWLEPIADDRGTTADAVEADYVVRTYVPLLSEPGVEKVFWYAQYDGGFKLDPPGQRALATMSSLLTGSEPLGQFQGEQDRGHPDDDVYEYRFARGRQRVSVLWKARGGDVPRAVSVTGLSGVDSVRLFTLEATDLSEDAGVSVPVRDGQVSIDLTERPVFLLFEQPGLVDRWWRGARGSFLKWWEEQQRVVEDWWEKRQLEIERKVREWLNRRKREAMERAQRELERFVEEMCASALIPIGILGMYAAVKGRCGS